MTTQQLPSVAMAHRVTALTHLSAEQLVAADGSIWSHAATLGTRIKGSEFTIDQAVIDNFITVFTTGYPQKVPVDYEHGTVSGATDFGNPVPKAGDVCELKGVYTTADFTGELRSTAEKLAKEAGRTLDDPRNLGLWMRWKPTNRALGMIKEREYSDLSIAFAPVEHNVTGADQGEVLISVALTNLPFLDDMLPVAASLFTVAARGDRSTPASPDNHPKERTMTPKLTLLSAVAAVLAKPVADDDQAVTELTQFGAEVKTIRTFATDVAAEIGETDPAKAVAKVKELKAAVGTHELTAKTAKEKAIKTTVDATLKEHESKFIPAMRPMLERELTRELGEGKEPKDTETVKALTAAPATGITTRATGADDGSSSANSGDDVKLDKKAKEFMNSNAELKALNEKHGFSVAFSRALTMAREELGLPAKLKAV